MLSELLQKASLFRLLYQIDLDLANQQRQSGCPHCGGRLDRTGYERKPRGGPPGLKKSTTKTKTMLPSDKKPGRSPTKHRPNSI